MAAGPVSRPPAVDTAALLHNHPAPAGNPRRHKKWPCSNVSKHIFTLTHTHSSQSHSFQAKSHFRCCLKPHRQTPRLYLSQYEHHLATNHPSIHKLPQSILTNRIAHAAEWQKRSQPRSTAEAKNCQNQPGNPKTQPFQI